MNDFIIVKDLCWRGPVLTFCFNRQPQENVYLTNGKKNYLLTKNGDEYYLCLTNVPDDQMVNGRDWYIVSGKQRVGISPDCAEKLEDKGRVFKYGLGFYAYIVDFQVLEIEGSMYFNMHATFYKNNKHPQKRDFLCESKSVLAYILKLGNCITEHSVQMIYFLFSLLRRKKRVLLMSETRMPISGNLKALDDRMKEKKIRERIIYYFDKTLDHKKISIYFRWIRLIWKIAGSKLVFVDDYAPVFKFLSLRKQTILVQLWHAGVGFKAVGYARFGKEGSPYPYQSGHRKYDYAVVGSEGLIETYSEVFGLSKEHFLPFGLPRLDGYLEENKIEAYREKFYSIYPQLKNRKIILFAPTYRGSTQDRAFYPYEQLDYTLISKWISQGYAFLVKMHPFVKEKITIPDAMQDFFIDVSEGNDINELFYVTDILITDYSSNIYEFSLFLKPILFFAYDYEEYRILRGMQNRLEELNFGVIATKFQEISDAIMNEDFHMDGISEYINKFHNKSNQRSCDQIISYFMLK